MKKIITLFAASISFAITLSGQPTPVAYYPFNGNANNAAGNGPNGTLYGSPLLTTDRQGSADKAYAFDGVNDYIDLGSSQVLKPTTAVTLALWAYNTNWSSFTSWAALASNTASGGYELIIHGSTGVVESEVQRNNSYGITNYSLSNLASGWHHFAFTFDGRYNILYIDGVAKNTNDAGATYPIQYGYPGNSTIIGDEAGTGSTPEGDRFTGKIDEVRFYDTALSAQQIQNLYNSTIGIAEITTLNDINIYPNPNNGNFSISVPTSSSNYIVTLTDLTGKIVQSNTLSSAHGLISYSLPTYLPIGLYLMTIQNNMGYRSVQRIIYQ